MEGRAVVNIELVKEVRNRSGVSMSACKRVLEQTDGDVEKALEALKKEGLLRAADRAGRIATQGKLAVYNHNGSKTALAEINCETDFCAKSPDFNAFCEAVTLQIVGVSPIYVSAKDIPPGVLAKQREIFEAQLRETPTPGTLGALIEKKPPEAAWPKIIDGKLKKWTVEVCLMEQESVVTPGKTIEQLRIELVAKCGENIVVRRFVRWEIGEGLGTKPVEDYASAIWSAIHPGDVRKD